MARSVIGSILHGAYGDLYEQAICLKHYAANHPEVELKLFTATKTRLESFRALDFPFATVFDLWTEIENHPNISRFFQFQIFDGELNRDILNKLPESILAKFDRTRNKLPWVYMRKNRLTPPPNRYKLTLSEYGLRELDKVVLASGIPEGVWRKQTINFLWRYRSSQRIEHGISSVGQKAQDELVQSYSAMFQRIASEFDCHFIVCGMKIVTTEFNRAITDNKFPDFGLDLPPERTTYLKGLSWPIELEIASRSTACCGNASGFTEGLWLKRGGNVVLMDAPLHYLAKIAYHRMPYFGLNRPLALAEAFFNRSTDAYRRRIESILRRDEKQNLKQR